MSLNIPHPWLLPWMFSPEYIHLVTSTFRRRHRFGASVDELPLPNRLTNLADFDYILSRRSTRAKNYTPKDHIHEVRLAHFEETLRINAAARLSAILKLSGLSLSVFSIRYAFNKGIRRKKSHEHDVEVRDPVSVKVSSEKSLVRLATVSDIVSKSNPVNRKSAELIAKDLGFDVQWFYWDDFCLSSCVDFFDYYDGTRVDWSHPESVDIDRVVKYRFGKMGRIPDWKRLTCEEIKTEIYKSIRKMSASVMSFTVRLNDAIPDIFWPECPCWVEPYMLVAYVARAEGWRMNDPRATAWPKPIGIPSYSWNDVLANRDSGLVNT